MSDQENAILKGIKNNEKWALKKLYHTYYADLCRYCLRIVNNASDAEEIVQEVIINIWERRDSLNIISFKSYLYTAVKFRAINLLKSQIKKADLFTENFEDIVSEDPGIVSEMEHSELLIALQNAIENLPLKCKTVYSLSRNAGLSYKEIAQELDISVKTVENHMAVALKRIRDSFKSKL